MKIWILTSEYNEYDQYGEYFLEAFKDKPTIKQILKTEVGSYFHAEERADDLLKTGKSLADVTYNLREHTLVE